jgi:hypothetical protein
LLSGALSNPFPERPQLDTFVVESVNVASPPDGIVCVDGVTVSVGAVAPVATVTV